MSFYFEWLCDTRDTVAVGMSFVTICSGVISMLHSQQIAQGSVHYIEHFTESAADRSR